MPRMNFGGKLEQYGLTAEEVADWGPRVIDDEKRTVILARIAGASLETAGKAIGRSRETAVYLQTSVLRAIRAAKEGRKLDHFKEKPMNNENLDYANNIADQSRNEGVLEGLASQTIPTVVVVVSGGVAEVLYADQPVRVIIADYDNAEGDSEDPTNIEDHDGALVSAGITLAEVNEDGVAFYNQALAGVGG